jgi:hypothetical protein
VKQHWSTAKQKLTASGITAPDVDDETLSKFAREGVGSDVVDNLVYGYGLSLCDKFSPEDKRTWELKLVLPKEEDVTAAQNALEANTSFQAAVESLSKPVTRLVAVHLFNALIFNRVSVADAKGIKLTEWGSTSTFATRKTPFSLVPLSYAYGPRTLNESYAAALAGLVSDGLSRITHTQVRERFKELVVELASHGTQG